MSNPQNKTNLSDLSQIRQKLTAAKTTLGMKRLNVTAAASGLSKVKNITQKSPNMPINQILNRLTPREKESYTSVSGNVPIDSLKKGVSLSQFRRQLQTISSTTKKNNLNNSIEFIDQNNISESKLKDELSPPPMLVLKRTGIRIFPDGRRVAMYINQKLGVVFTIPYKGAGGVDVIPGVTSEEIEHEEILESFEQLQAYASQESPKSKSKHFKFADGSKIPVAHGVVKAMHMVHGELNPENQKKYQTMLSDPKGFSKAADFAMSKVQWTIKGK